MKVSEYINYLVTGECSKLAISDVGDMSLNPSGSGPSATQVLNQNKFINYVNLSNLAVHKRFHLLQKEVELDNPLEGEEFKLPDDFLTPIQAYYLTDFEPVTIKDSYVNIVGAVDSAVSILIPEPFLAVIKGTDSKKRTPIILKYAAAPTTATKAAANLKISEVYTEPLLNYAAYILQKKIFLISNL